MSVELRAGSASDKGNVRKSNQDRQLIAPRVFAVADGMGGHAGGEVAATTAINTVEAVFSQEDQTTSQPLGLLSKSIEAANRAIWSEAASNRNIRGMGTTLVGLAILNDGTAERVVVANVGDSRAYVLKDGARLVQISNDHTLVEAMVGAGELSAQEATVHPNRHILTRALGTEPNVIIDTWQMDPSAGDRYQDLV